MSDGAFVTVIVGVILLIVAVVTAITMMITYQVDKDRCGQWGDITGRETKFERTSVVTWDCFTRDSEGTWLPISQVRDIG